ncbi:hypothetical protein NCC49_005686 [Naganishia albida]|nr:hypothetical protein NCC49_005686 [Naganishia albida]
MSILQGDLQVALVPLDFIQNEDESLDFKIKRDPNWRNLAKQYLGLSEPVMSRVGAEALIKEKDLRKLVEIGDQVFPKCQDPQSPCVREFISHTPRQKAELVKVWKEFKGKAEILLRRPDATHAISTICDQLSDVLSSLHNLQLSGITLPEDDWLVFNWTTEASVREVERLSDYVSDQEKGMMMTNMEEEQGESRRRELVSDGAADGTSETIISNIRNKLYAARQSIRELRDLQRFELSAREWSNLNSRTDDLRSMVDSLVPA